MASNIRLKAERRRLLRIAGERRTTIDTIKLEEAAVLDRLAVSPWIGARIKPALPPDHPSLDPVEEPIAA